MKSTFGGIHGGQIGEYHYNIGVNAQGRHNPKAKVTDFADSDGEFSAREFESDVRDGTDYSFSGSLQGPLGPVEFGLNANLVRTDRDEHENVQSFELDDDTLELDEIAAQSEAIEQRNYTIGTTFTLPFASGKTVLDLSYARFEDDIVSTEFEADPEDPLVAVERETTDSTDTEIGSTLAHTFELGAGSLKLGLDYLDKNRDTNIWVFAIDGDEIENDTPWGPPSVRRIASKAPASRSCSAKLA